MANCFANPPNFGWSIYAKNSENANKLETTSNAFWGSCP
jgi:hypothetical protein